MSKTCDQCGTPFTPREAKQRFCRPACKTEWFNNERKAALAKLRAEAGDQPQESAA